MLLPQNMRMRFKFSTLLLLVLLLEPSVAHAYIDPGSGMLIWQGLIAAIGAVIIFVRQPRETIKRLIRRFRGK